MRFRSGGKHFFNCTRDAYEWDAAIEKRLDGDFVGGIQGNAVSSSLFGSFVGQAQAGKRAKSGGSKSRWRRAARSKVRWRPALGVSHRIEDGQAHVVTEI